MVAVGVVTVCARDSSGDNENEDEEKSFILGSVLSDGVSCEEEKEDD